MTKLGPCFIKLAQTLSMRPDLVGETYAESLSELQVSSKQHLPGRRGPALAWSAAGFAFGLVVGRH